MKFFLATITVLISFICSAQELYPYSEPASNMPAKSISTKLTAMYGKVNHTGRLSQRYMPELMFGFDKKWMVHASATFSDMMQPRFYFESVRGYAKYRFLSNDELHKHFRMAAFVAASYSRNSLNHNELNLMGDHTGVQLGVIATKLKNKFAVSATASLIEVLDTLRWSKYYDQQYAYQSLNYSLSAGYLLFPREYKDYNQLNVNLYVEALGGYNLDWEYEKGYIDLAPSIQFIFKSTGKLNIGYRFQLESDVNRMMDNSFMISYEHIFLNALKRK